MYCTYPLITLQRKTLFVNQQLYFLIVPSSKIFKTYFKHTFCFREKRVYRLRVYFRETLASLEDGHRAPPPRPTHRNVMYS